MDFYSTSSLKQQSVYRHFAPLGHVILIPSQPLHHPYDFNRCDTTYYAKLPFYFVEIYFRLPFTICGAGTGHPSGTPGFTPGF